MQSNHHSAIHSRLQEHQKHNFQHIALLDFLDIILLSRIMLKLVCISYSSLSLYSTSCWKIYRN